MSAYTNDAGVLVRVFQQLRLLGSDDMIVGSRLLADNRDAFLAAWGKETCRFRGEHVHWIWRFEEDGLPAYVLTGVQGTSFEVHHAMSDDAVLRVLRRALDAVTAWRSA